MPNIARKEHPADQCPLCFLKDNVTETLQYNKGKFAHFCNRGHEFIDREELTSLMMTVSAKKRETGIRFPIVQQAQVQATTPGTPDHDITVIEHSDPISIDRPPESIEPVRDLTAPIQAGTKSVVIGPVDFVRLASILGHFDDSSSLFGAVVSLNMQLADERELRTRAEAARAIGATPRKIGGDALVQVIIPERHVIPIQDLAEANGLDMTRYLNSRIEEGLDSNWFY